MGARLLPRSFVAYFVKINATRESTKLIGRGFSYKLHSDNTASEIIFSTLKLIRLPAWTTAAVYCRVNTRRQMAHYVTSYCEAF